MPELPAEPSPTAAASALFERASRCLDRGEGDAARTLVDEGLDLDPSSELGRQLLDHILRREGRFQDLLERLVRLAQRVDRTSRAAALKEAARIAAGPLSDPARALELYRESLQVVADDAVLAEAISRGVRHGLLDASARLMPELQANLRAERLTELAESALARGDRRLALECRAAAFADVPARDRLDALDPVLYRAVGDPPSEADALIEAIRTMPPEAPPEAILERLRRVSTACADQAILTRGLAAMGDREQSPQEEEVATRGWGEVRKLSDAVGSLVDERARGSQLSRGAGPIEADAPLLSDTLGDGVPLGPAEAVQLHLGAGDVESLVERIQDAIERKEAIDRATWLRAGRFLSAMGRVIEARQCLLFATGERAAWDRAAAEALASQGDHREAARALVATEVPSKAPDLRWLGELYLLDGDDAEAMKWYERALAADPKEASVAARLVELASRANHNDRVDQIASSHRDLDSAPWHLAVARALRRRGDSTRAQEAVDRALKADPSLLEPAILLFDLGRERGDDAWIDRALSEIRARALERGQRSRAFVAAGLLVARGAASEEDQLTYEALRIDLSTAPRATLPAGWADRWLIHVDASAGEVKFDEDRARPVDLEPGFLDALEAAEGVFGVADVRVVALFEEGPPTAVWDEGRRVGFVHNELVRWLPKTFRFEVGRALAALTEPRLRGGLVDAQLTAEGTVVLLDRAGLIVAQDPVPVLESLGAKTPRGRALTAFAVSEELYALWARLGLGVVPPNATVAKPLPSA